MKRKCLLGILAIMAAFALPTQAENSDRTMAISASPIALIGLRVDLLYQYKLLNFLALTVPGKFGYNYFYSTFIEKFEKEKLGESTIAPIDMATGVGARFLLSNTGLNNTFYIEPRLLIGYEQFGYKYGGAKIEVSSARFQPMLQFGWDWYWDYGLYMNLGAGVGYAFRFAQKLEIPPKLNEFKDNALVGFFIPTTSGTLALDGEFKVGFSW